jgi:hypothetical protein
MWQKTVGLVGFAFGALACGAAPAPAPKQAPAPVSVAVPASSQRTASADIRRYWSFGETQFALYAGVDSLMHTELFAGLVPGILGQSEDFLKATQRDCIQILATHAKELAAGVDERGGLMILELGPEGVKAARSVCVGSLFPVDRVAVAGADEAYASGTDMVVVQPGVVLFGSKPMVEASLAAVDKPAPFPVSLTLKDDQHLVFSIKMPREGISGGGALRVTPERFRVEADVTLPTEAMADMAEQKVKQTREQATALGRNQPQVPVAKLLGALDVQRHGKRFSAAFELREPVVDQARDLGVLIGLSVYGARRYMQDAKSAEARVVLAQIAKSYAVTLLEPPAAGKRPGLKKLVSLPAVPATVPRGVAYQSAAGEWKAWEPIHFSLSEPQRYQYEVVAAKDGKTAEILGRGDLDGNGKTSLFRLKISLDPKTLELTAVDHTEEAPLE